MADGPCIVGRVPLYLQLPSVLNKSSKLPGTQCMCWARTPACLVCVLIGYAGSIGIATCPCVFLLAMLGVIGIGVYLCVL